jgi:hypothetical protein
MGTRDTGRFDAPFWGVLLFALLSIGVASLTFLALDSADRVTELGARIPT